MARDLTAGLLTETQADSLSPVILAEFEFSGGTVNFFTGFGTLNWDSKAWTGTGYFGGVSAVEETTDTRSTGVKFTLSGMPASVVSIALTQEYQGRAARVWLGAMDDNNRLIADPYKIFVGQMDIMEIMENPDAASITLSAENELVDLERPREFRYTPEDHKTHFSGDTGFDYVAALQDVEVVWGNEKATPTIIPSKEVVF